MKNEQYPLKRLAVIFLVSGIITAFSAVTAGAELGATPQLLTGILAKMEKANRDLKSLRAVVTQERVNIQIGAKDIDSGVILYKPGDTGKGKMRIDYSKPGINMVSIIGDNFVFYQPRINQVLKTTIAKAAKGRATAYQQLVGLDRSLKSLLQNYKIEYVKDEEIDRQMTTQLRLSPKESSHFAGIEIWVSNLTWLPIQHKFIEHNGDYTIVKLTNLELNLKLSDEAFIIKYPSNTVVVDKLEE